MRSGLLGGGGSGNGRALGLLWQRLKSSQQMLTGMVAGLCLASFYYSLRIGGREGRRGPGAGGKGMAESWDPSVVTLYGSTNQPRAKITRDTMGVAGRPLFVLFGDSLTQRGFELETQGWVAGLANAYTRRADILNRGFSGYNSRWCMLMLEDLFPASSPMPSLVVIFLGANDAALPNRHQHAEVSEYMSNLKAMVHYFRHSFASPPSLLLLTPPPVIERLWGAHCVERGRALDRLDEVTARYTQACLKVAEDENVPVVDLRKALLHASSGAEGLLLDGLHFNDKGNGVVLRAVLSAIETYYPDLAPSTLPMQAPDHTFLDSNTRRLTLYTPHD